jgi:hypothetical protein
MTALRKNAAKSCPRLLRTLASDWSLKIASFMSIFLPTLGLVYKILLLACISCYSPTSPIGLLFNLYTFYVFSTRTTPLYALPRP